MRFRGGNRVRDPGIPGCNSNARVLVCLCECVCECAFAYVYSNVFVYLLIAYVCVLTYVRICMRTSMGKFEYCVYSICV